MLEEDNQGMKQFLFIISLLITSSLSSQTIERIVIGSSGTTLSKVNASLDFTVGELVVTTDSNATLVLTQGFHQEEISIEIKFSPIVFLQGALANSDTITMDDSLRSNSLIPTTSPYSNSETCNAEVFNATGTNAIIDWVWVTLRDKDDASVILDSQSALLQADGDVVAIDGVSNLSIDLPVDSYYVTVNHRNHLGIMSATPVTLHTSKTTVINLSDVTTSVFGGSNAVVDMGNGIFAMISGDFDENGQVQNSDASKLIQHLGVSGYNKADLDMNTQVQNSDVNNLLNPNIGKGQQF